MLLGLALPIPCGLDGALLALARRPSLVTIATRRAQIILVVAAAVFDFDNVVDFHHAVEAGADVEEQKVAACAAGPVAGDDLAA